VTTSLTKTILLVDDDPRNLIALGALLEPTGHRLVTASGGRSAIAAFGRERPDLVLCDFAMPECDGIDVLNAIRRDPIGAETPVVIVTAYSEREHRLRALQAGADDFLEKPIDEPVLMARVRNLLRLKHSRDALESARVELAFRHEALKRLQNDQRELMDFILHDLRMPITALQLALDWCRDNTPPAAVEFLSVIEEAKTAAHRVSRMSEDLVSISQLEDEGFPVKLSRVRLDAVVEDVLASCRALLEHRRLDVVSAGEQSSEAIGDAALMRRVVENLIDNAIRHTRNAGRVRVEVAVRDGAQVIVSNDGAPLSAAEHARVFEKYVRGSSSQGPSHAGLGLYFCKRAMLAQHGDIAIVDVPGWPASFALTLPCA
jgi:two-component system sensor histidine kinase/response regulator